MTTIKTIGKVALTLVGCALMPVMLWVAMFAAIYHWARIHRETAQVLGQPVTAGAKR